MKKGKAGEGKRTTRNYGREGRAARQSDASKFPDSGFWRVASRSVGLTARQSDRNKSRQMQGTGKATKGKQRTAENQRQYPRGSTSVLDYFERHDKLAGTLAAAFLPLFYFAILGAIGGIPHALLQLSSMAPWIAALSVGLGLQAQLYFRLKRLHRNGSADAKGIAAAGGVSTGAMLACCAHHASDVLPVFGLAAAASVLAYYQDFFLLFGILSNGAGLLYMLSCYQKTGLKTGGFLDLLFRTDLKRVLPFYLVSSAALLLVFLFRLFANGPKVV
ncbi:hypothetical protein HZC09_00565 [Candidatus Micrarchaeota archaeon]|nr:hypothetical protein [Candidatus Micrarchaeota archaeon]